MSPRLSIGLLFFLTTLASAQTHTEDVIYMKAGGTAFTMDVLRPAKPNKAAVVFVVSGGWISDHSMLESYGPDLQKGLVDGGFTVFAVVHGAQPRFKVADSPALACTCTVKRESCSRARPPRSMASQMFPSRSSSRSLMRSPGRPRQRLT